MEEKKIQRQQQAEVREKRTLTINPKGGVEGVPGPTTPKTDWRGRSKLQEAQEPAGNLLPLCFVLKILMMHLDLAIPLSIDGMTDV